METKIIGNKIAEARKQMNMSQAQLAERLFISPQAVGKWERGESMPDITTFGRMAKILGVDLNYFSANGAETANGREAANGAETANAAEPCPTGLADAPAQDAAQSSASAQTATSAQIQASAPATDVKKRPARNLSMNTWADVDFSGLSNIKETVSAANFRRCRLIDSDLIGLVLKNDVMHECDFSGSNLGHCRFQGSNLEGSTFSRCSLIEADFSVSTIKGCHFEGADLTKTFFSFSTITRMEVKNAILNGTVFKDSTLEDVVFEGNIENCHFEQCSFKNVEFRDTTLLNTFFKNNSNLKKVRFTQCKVDSLTFAFLKNDKANTEGLGKLDI